MRLFTATDTGVLVNRYETSLLRDETKLTLLDLVKT